MTRPSQQDPGKKGFEGHSQTVSNRRQFAAALGIFAGLAVPTALRGVSKWLNRSLSIISIRSALENIPEQSRLVITDKNQFTEVAYLAITTLNSIPNKELNQLFVQGLKLVQKNGYNFELNTETLDPYIVDTRLRVIAVSSKWIEQESSRAEKSETNHLTSTAFCLAALGGALATILAEDRISLEDGFAGRNNQLGTQPIHSGLQRDKSSTGSDLKMQAHPAALVVGILVAEQMYSRNLNRDFNEWHMISPVALARNDDNSPVRECIRRNADLLFGESPTNKQIELEELTLTRAQELMRSLGFADRTIEGRFTF
ncbi:MAG: hypothetical protein ACK5GN_12195 [Pseudomonadota bacterium]|jgi:hypothetical protein